MWVSMNHLREGWQGSERSPLNNPGEVNLLAGEAPIAQLNFPLHLSVQGGSKSVSQLAYGVSISDPLSKHAIPIVVTLPLTPFLGSIPIQS